MTPQEQKMLDDLMARVDSTRLDDKDPEAAQRIEEWSRRNPDAAYILAQTVLVQSYALEQAKAQIQSLQQSLQQQTAQRPALAQQPPKQGSFLGHLFGHQDEGRSQQPAPGYAQPQPQQGYAQVPQYAAQQQYGQPAGYPPPGYGAPAAGGSSFLRSAATTAAGVAAGALAFQGIESLMHGFGHAAGFGGFGDAGTGLGEFGGRPEETIVNNYYDSSAPGQDKSPDIQQLAHEGDSSLNTQQDLASDVNVDDGGGQLQADTDLPTLDDDSGSFDDASLDDSGSFDDSSFGNS